VGFLLYIQNLVVSFKGRGEMVEGGRWKGRGGLKVLGAPPQVLPGETLAHKKSPEGL